MKKGEKTWKFFYNGRFREIGDNGMSESQLAQATLFYLEGRPGD